LIVDLKVVYNYVDMAFRPHTSHVWEALEQNNAVAHYGCSPLYNDAVAVDKIVHLVVCKILIAPDEASGKL
jgi:hypothetical protein